MSTQAPTNDETQRVRISGLDEKGGNANPHLIDPTHSGNYSRFFSGINNRNLLSKRKANVRSRRFAMDNKVHVALFTSRDIEAGEILSYDYNAGNHGKCVEEWAKAGFYDTSNFF